MTVAKPVLKKLKTRDLPCLTVGQLRKALDQLLVDDPTADNLAVLAHYKNCAGGSVTMIVENTNRTMASFKLKLGCTVHITESKKS